MPVPSKSPSWHNLMRVANTNPPSSSKSKTTLTSLCPMPLPPTTTILTTSSCPSSQPMALTLNPTSSACMTAGDNSSSQPKTPSTAGTDCSPTDSMPLRIPTSTPSTLIPLTVNPSEKQAAFYSSLWKRIKKLYPF